LGKVEKLQQQESRGTVGLILAIFALVQAVIAAVGSFAVLFFAPLIMCGVSLYTLPLSLVAIVLGWLSRKQSPRLAWITIVLAILASLVAIGAALFYGHLVGEATA